MLIEIIGRRRLPDDVDREDVEDLLIGALGERGGVAGAGSGMGRWHLDVEVPDDADDLDDIVADVAGALTGEGLGWVEIRLENEDEAVPAEDLCAS